MRPFNKIIIVTLSSVLGIGVAVFDRSEATRRPASQASAIIEDPSFVSKLDLATLRKLFPEGEYVASDKSKANDCEDVVLEWKGKAGSHTLVVYPSIQFPQVNEGPFEEIPGEPEETCRFRSETKLDGTRLIKRIQISDCPKGEEDRTITEILELDDGKLRYSAQTSTENDKKSFSCVYRRGGGGQ